jgi:general secretion pathway protein C
MRRWSLIASFLLFIALCASATYWGMQLFKPPLRPVAAPTRAAQADIRTDAAASLFGGRKGKVEVASNYQLKGVVFAPGGVGSVAILSADGKPAQAVRVNAEVLPGVTVKEVHRNYVLLSENGVSKRVELPESAQDQANINSAAPLGSAPGPQGANRMPPQMPPAVPSSSTSTTQTPVPGVVPPPNQPNQANQPANPGQGQGVIPPPSGVITQPSMMQKVPSTAPPTTSVSPGS